MSYIMEENRRTKAKEKISNIKVKDHRFIQYHDDKPFINFNVELEIQNWETVMWNLLGVN